MNYITKEDFPLLKPEEYSTEKCWCRSGLLMSLEKRQRNTSFIEEERNWISPCCDDCFADDFNYYEERWREHYGYRL